MNVGNVGFSPVQTDLSVYLKPIKVAGVFSCSGCPSPEELDDETASPTSATEKTPVQTPAATQAPTSSSTPTPTMCPVPSITPVQTPSPQPTPTPTESFPSPSPTPYYPTPFATPVFVTPSPVSSPTPLEPSPTPVPVPLWVDDFEEPICNGSGPGDCYPAVHIDGENAYFEYTADGFSDTLPYSSIFGSLYRSPQIFNFSDFKEVKLNFTLAKSEMGGGEYQFCFGIPSFDEKGEIDNCSCQKIFSGNLGDLNTLNNGGTYFASEITLSPRDTEVELQAICAMVTPTLSPDPYESIGTLYIPLVSVEEVPRDDQTEKTKKQNLRY